MSPAQGRRSGWHAAYWLAPSLLCLALYWRGFTGWFRADDFAWLGTGIYIQNFHDLLIAIFAPQAQGTIRPLSERLFFLAGFSIFGMEALPFKIVIFLTQFANLVLVASIGSRITGKRAAGFVAAVLWVLNASGILPLGWVCVYNQVLCGFFLLLALHFLMRRVETGERRYRLYEWAAFVLGFGALELNVVYPAIAAAYLYLCAPGRKYLRGTIPMFAVSAAYSVVHTLAAPAQKSGDYAMHFTGAIFRTLAKYWTWSVGPTFAYTPLALPKWVLPLGVALLSAALLAFAAWKVRRGVRAALFFLAWYLAVIAPVLPLRDHMTEYYVFLPVIGLCWLGGWAAAEAWHAGVAARTGAIVLAVLYALLGVPSLVASSEWNHTVTMRVRTLVEGVAGIHELHPKESILLEGVDSDLFWNAVLDRPFRLFGLDHIYLAPGSEKRIEAHPDLGNVSDFILPADVVTQALKRSEIVVYDVRGPRLRNITEIYASTPHDNTSGVPQRVDAASPLTQYLLGPEWYESDGDHRWMPKRATLRMGAPAAAGLKLYLRGACPEELLKEGALPVQVTVDGIALPKAEIRPGETAFELAFPLPDSLVGKTAMRVTVEAGRSFRPASDPRDLGLAFGSFEVR
ncbi:MAG: hypothetical protein ABI759_31720 [Candidatus Solibacter sp.]